MKHLGSDGFKRILIFSDVHSVFVDTKAWKIFLQVVEDYKPDEVVSNGDLLDCVGISEHASKLSAHSPDILDDFPFAYEIDFTRTQLLEPLRKAMGPKAKLTLRLGNHEWRFIRPNKANAKALAEILDTCTRRGQTTLEGLLKLHSPKIDARLSYNGVDDLYGFTVIHGVKTSPGAPKANLMRYGSGTSGHSHRSNSYLQVVGGKAAGWWESSCLRTTRKVEYLIHGDLPDWNNGFLSLTINPKTGLFFCKTHLIVNNTCEFNGRIYTA